MKIRIHRSGKLLGRLLLLLGLIATLGLLTGTAALPAYAGSTLIVTNCSNDSQLQADVSQANSDNNEDVINFACSGDIPLSKTLTITGSMAIFGYNQNVILDGQHQLPVFTVDSGINLTLDFLTIANGSASYSGGGLNNQGGTVSLNYDTFAGNSSRNGNGGGLFNDGGTLTIYNSIFTGNSTQSADGGGLYNGNGGTVSLSYSAFTGNSAQSGDGGGLKNYSGTVTIGYSTFASNSAGSGGGLFNSDTVTISSSTFTGNSSSNYGGGALYNFGGTASISNSTFTGNSSPYGGALLNSSVSGFSSLSITNSTLAGNSATYGDDLNNYYGERVIIGGSILAGNNNDNCINNGTINDQGYNLSNDSSCGLTGTGDLQNTNPQLASLAYNGGPTQTMALQQSSPAIDQVPVASCPSTDQRGVTRPDNGETSCDMGAYEFSDAPFLFVTGNNVTTTEGASFSGMVASGSYAGNGTLSATIDWGDGSAPTSGTINGSSGFTVSGSHTYTEEGSYAITVTVSNGQVQSVSGNGVAMVYDAALSLTQFVAGSPSHLKANVNAVVTDADPDGQASDYTATINWGDGTTSTVKVGKTPIHPKGFDLVGSHTYAQTGTYTVTLLVTDQGGSQVSKTVSVTVN